MTPQMRLNITEIISLLYRSCHLGGIAESGGSTSSAGIEIHQKIQRKFQARKVTGKTLIEEPIFLRLHHRGLLIELSGRVDLLLFSKDQKQSVIEIKSCQSPAAMCKSLSKQEPCAPDHPHIFQVSLYALLIFLKNTNADQILNVASPRIQLFDNIESSISAHLMYASVRSSAIKWFDVALNPIALLNKLGCLLDQWLNENWLEQRKVNKSFHVARTVRFPYAKIRDSQKNLMNHLVDQLGQKEALFVQSPTGSGKTISSLYPALKKLSSSCSTVFFGTSKNSQKIAAQRTINDIKFSQQQAPEESRAHLLSKKLKRFHNPSAVILSSRESLCLQIENPICKADHCRFANRYFLKLRKGRVLQLAHKELVFDSKLLKKLGSFYEVCPFELALDLSLQVQVVICDFNHIISPQSQIQRHFKEPAQRSKVQLIIDEAHNLPQRIRQEYSPILSTQVPEISHSWMKRFFTTWKKTMSRLFEIEDSEIKTSDATFDQKRVIEVTESVRTQFKVAQSALSNSYSKYTDKIGSMAYNDPVNKIYQEFSAFCELIQTKDFGKKYSFSLITYTEGSHRCLKILCKDASAMMQELVAPMKSPIFMSATLNPLEYYARSLGFTEKNQYHFFNLPSPFESKNHRLFIVPQVTTLFKCRKSQIPKIADCVSKILMIQKVNTFVFCPSFDIINELSRICIFDANIDVYFQKSGSSQEDIETLLKKFRESGDSKPKKQLILFAVLGGGLAEGVDLPGKALESIIIIGPALPNINLEQTLTQQYESSQGRNGFDTACVIPSMTRVNQAIGRLIRSENDKGTCFLLDRRFTEESYFSRLSLEWKNIDCSQHISNCLTQDIHSFWETASPQSKHPTPASS